MNLATLKQFNYLVKIVEEGSFIAASEKLFIAQSALSRQIKLLEEEIEFELFDRREKRATLTKAGEMFYRKIKNNLQNIDQIIELSKSVAMGNDITIKIAHSSSIVIDQFKISALQKVSEKHNLKFDINTFSSEYQVQAILTGEIDLGLFRLPISQSVEDLNVIRLYQQPLYVAIHKEHYLCKDNTEISIQQLKDEAFVSTPHRARSVLNYLVNNLCLAAGFIPKQAKIQSRKVAQLQLVAAKIGVCIVPEEFKSIVPENVRLLPLKEKGFNSEVVLAWKKDSDQKIEKCAQDLVKGLCGK